MNIGARGHDLGGTSVEEILFMCREYRVKGLQLVVNKTWEQLYVDRNIVEICNRIHQIKEAGIDIYLLGTYFNPIHPSAEAVEAGIEKVLFNLEIAKRCNIQYIGSETGSLNGDQWTYHCENHKEENYIEVGRIFSKFKNELQEKGKEFLIEPVYDHVIHDKKVLNDLLIQLDSNNYGITFDLVNLLNLDNYQEYEKIAEEFLQLHSKKIKVIHLKNFIIKENKKALCKLNDGIIDYTKFLQLLKKYELQNLPYIVEEIENDWLKESIAYLLMLEKN